MVAAGGAEEDFLVFKTEQILSPELTCEESGG